MKHHQKMGHCLVLIHVSTRSMCQWSSLSACGPFLCPFRKGPGEHVYVCWRFFVSKESQLNKTTNYRQMPASVSQVTVNSVCLLPAFL